MIEYKGYTGIVDFDPELRLFTGHVVDLDDEIYFEGDAVDHYLQVCEKRGEEPGRPFSGKLNLRLGPHLHRTAAAAAAAEGASLNNWLARVVESAARGTKTKRRPSHQTQREKARRTSKK